MTQDAWIQVLGMECWVAIDRIKILNSYTLAYADVFNFCVALREAAPFKYARTQQSWVDELVAHTVLFKLGLFTDRTRDADIDENETWLRLLGYKLIYRLNKLFKWYY